MVFHGAEHTRFGHSIGVMHLVSKAFSSAVKNGEYEFTQPKYEWYNQILRLIALTHDLGHAPFSHASESVFLTALNTKILQRKLLKKLA